MFLHLFYFFILICGLNQVSGSFLGDLLRTGANVKYQLADVSDNVVDGIRGVFQPAGFFGREILDAGRIDRNIGYNNGVPPVSPYDFYRSFAPSGNVRGQVGTGASLPSTSEALLAFQNERIMRMSNIQPKSPPLFRYFENSNSLQLN